MSDIASVWNPAAAASDWAFAAPDMVTGSDLWTSVQTSLFTDATAQADDALSDGSHDPRGWWGDAYTDRPIGSKLWLRMRGKQTAAQLALCKGDITQALAWLKTLGVVRAIEVYAEWTAAGFLGARITLHKPDGRAETSAYEWAWNQLDAAAAGAPGGPFTLGSSILGGGDVI